MLGRLTHFIEEKQLFKPGQKVLLAISGGIDSMVLLHLFERSGFEYGIAHCNFNLRGSESDADEEFVKSQVLWHGVPAFFKSFETEEHAKVNGISIEMAARELRYAYFEDVRAQNAYDSIATAHHQDDMIETFFLNLSRKTGIKGLTGIKEKNGKLIRPLLFANREEIENYAAENYLEYRKDSSNDEVIFQRNFVRHNILPLFSEMNPTFKKNLLASIENLKDAENVYSKTVEHEIIKMVLIENGTTTIDLASMLESDFPKILLFEILSSFNFNSSVIDDVFQSLENDSGKQFFSKTHRAIKDREKLFVTQIANHDNRIYYIEQDDIELFEPFDIIIGKFRKENFNITKKPNVACLDAQKLQFPLLLRKWQRGDYFQPLGMENFKKVSDFFIDQKFPLHEKENTWLLCSGKNIVWIMGHRIDNRFKVTPKTQDVVEVTLV